MFEDTGGQGRSHDAYEDLPDAGYERRHDRPDMRPIMLPCVTQEYTNDKTDILDLVRRRIEERGIKPIDIRRAGVTKWDEKMHWRLKCGAYDCNISQRRMYQLASAVGLKRTKQLPWSL